MKSDRAISSTVGPGVIRFPVVTTSAPCPAAISSAKIVLATVEARIAPRPLDATSSVKIVRRLAATTVPPRAAISKIVPPLPATAVKVVRHRAVTMIAPPRDGTTSARLRAATTVLPLPDAISTATRLRPAVIVNANRREATATSMPPPRGRCATNCPK
jgi:hypothetical protein